VSAEGDSTQESIMSWIKPVGKKALKYGPQAQLVWKHAGKPATAAARRAVASAAARRTALRHADTVVQGAILKVFDHGTPLWVVFSGNDVVASYPSSATEPAALVANADESKKMTPDQFRARRAERSPGRRARDAAQLAREELRRRRSTF
jgi:hypothetical protein